MKTVVLMLIMMFVMSTGAIASADPKGSLEVLGDHGRVVLTSILSEQPRKVIGESVYADILAKMDACYRGDPKVAIDIIRYVLEDGGQSCEDSVSEDHVLIGPCTYESSKASLTVSIPRCK